MDSDIRFADDLIGRLKPLLGSVVHRVFVYSPEIWPDAIETSVCIVPVVSGKGPYVSFAVDSTDDSSQQFAVHSTAKWPESVESLGEDTDVRFCSSLWLAGSSEPIGSIDGLARRNKFCGVALCRPGGQVRLSIIVDESELRVYRGLPSDFRKFYDWQKAFSIHR